MAATRDILQSYRAPRAVFQRLLAAGQREDRAIAYLMAGCLVMFVAQWPGLQRMVLEDPDGPPLDARIGGALLAWVFVMPLLAYCIAALAHIIARLFGGQGTWYGARLALFWGLLTASPLMLLHGLATGVIGSGAPLYATGLLWWLAFLGVWGICLHEAERPSAAANGA
ncbi:MAG: YIP1 family protein [Pseudomonadota bacterium]